MIKCVSKTESQLFDLIMYITKHCLEILPSNFALKILIELLFGYFFLTNIACSIKKKNLDSESNRCY